MFSRGFGFASKHAKKFLLTGAAVAPASYFATCAVAGDIQCAHPPHYHWEFTEWNKFYDTASLRRGYQVYKEVCSSCHAMRFLCYRHLVGLIFTEREAKREAKAAMIEDGPDDEGELFLRPGTLADVVPPPYKNDLAARAANNGAIPPDMSILVGARHHEFDYIFSLIIGYSDEIPPGLELGEGQYYNPFMENGAIAMPPPLMDGAVSYPDGTEATVSQMAKDVTEFLTWSYWRYLEPGKQIGMIGQIFCFTGACFFFWLKKWHMMHIITQRITFKNKPWGMAGIP